MDNEIKIKIENLSKSFGTKTVLNNISLDIYRGKSLVILGGSGSGKSVFLKNILGIMKPDTGSVMIDGIEMTTASSDIYTSQLEKFGMLFQGGALFDSLSVWENITFGLRQRKKITRQESVDIAVDLVKQVGLSSDSVFLMPSELSGGMQKRVAMARAICTKPEIIFFDEPTAGLDPIMAGVISELIRETITNLSATGVTITHDMSCMRHIADNVCMIYQGGIIHNSSGEDIWKSDNDYVQQFIHGYGQIHGKIAV